MVRVALISLSAERSSNQAMNVGSPCRGWSNPVSSGPGNNLAARACGALELKRMCARYRRWSRTQRMEELLEIKP